MENKNGNDSFTFICSCGRKLRAKKEHIGKNARCSACGNKVKVPDPAALSPSPEITTSPETTNIPLANFAQQASFSKTTLSTISLKVKIALGICGSVILIMIATLLFFNGEKSVEEIAELTHDSVVLIYSGNNTIGSGFAVDDGLIVTNYHVITNCSDSDLSIHLSVRDDNMCKKTIYDNINVVAINVDMDIAVLKIEDCDIKPLKITTGTYKTGQKVIAIGNPAPTGEILSNSISNGVISNSNRQLDGKSYIQITAPVNPGNSGGPLLDMKGHVIGVVTLKTTQTEGIAFAIPIEEVEKLLDEYQKNPRHLQQKAMCTRCIDRMEIGEGLASLVATGIVIAYTLHAYSDQYYGAKIQDNTQKLLARMQEIQTAVSIQIKDLKDCPEDMCQCYAYILKAYEAFCEMANMAKYPEQYSISNEKIETLHSRFTQAISQAKVLAPK